MNQQQLPEPDHYGILGVDPKASQAEIKKAYHKAALANHPDKTGGASGELFVKIKAAYDVLSNENSRLLYNAKRRKQKQTPASWTYRDANAKPYSGAFNHTAPAPEPSYPFANFAKTYEEAMRAAEAEQQARAAEAQRQREEKLRRDNEERRAKREAQEKARREVEEQRRKVKEMQAELNSQAAASRARAVQQAAAQERLAAEEQRKHQQAREEETKNGPQPPKWATDWESKVAEESRRQEEEAKRAPQPSGSWEWDAARVAEEKATNEEILRRMNGEGVGATGIDEKLRRLQEEAAARASENFRPRQNESKKDPEYTPSWNWNPAGAAEKSAQTEDILRRWREEIAAATEERERKIKQQTADANSHKAADQARARQEEQAAGERLTKEYHNTARPPPTETKADRKRTRSGGPVEHTGNTPQPQPSRKRSTAPPFDDNRARFEKERQEAEGREQARQEKEWTGAQQPGTQKPCEECVHNAATIESLKIIIKRQKIELQEMKTKYDALLQTTQPPMPGISPETPQQYDQDADDEKSTASTWSDIDSEILDKAKPSGASSTTSSNEGTSAQPRPFEKSKPFGTFTSGNESPFAKAAKEHKTNGGIPLFAKLNNPNFSPFRHSRNGGVDLLYCGRCGKNVDHRFTGCDEEEL